MSAGETRKGWHEGEEWQWWEVAYECAGETRKGWHEGEEWQWWEVACECRRNKKRLACGGGVAVAGGCL